MFSVEILRFYAGFFCSTEKAVAITLHTKLIDLTGMGDYLHVWI